MFFLPFFNNENKQRCLRTEQHTYTFNTYMDVCIYIYMFITYLLLFICFILQRKSKTWISWNESEDILVSTHVNVLRTSFYIFY